MASQFSATTISQINNIHLAAFMTYKRDVQFTFHLKPREVVVSDPNYDYEFDYDEPKNNEIVTQSFSADACVTYLKRQEFSDYVRGEDTGIRYKSIFNRIRVQVKEEAFQYLKDAERYQFGDEIYAIEAAWRKMGSLGTFIIYEIVLQRVV